MKILFISSANMMATHIAYKMVQEGHDVKLFIDDEDRKESFNNLVPKTNDWRSELAWLGKESDSLIVFDDIGYGIEQDELRSQGYSVFGGSALADKLESDRQYAHDIFTKYGITTVLTKDFDNIDKAISFVEENKGFWVVKQNGHSSKGLNYVGNFEDGADVISILKNYKENLDGKIKTITLQQKINGVEIGVARYFNGEDWVGPIEVNIEHKKFFPDNLGPMTSEMGTVAWYDDNEDNKLFKETLAKLKPHLKEIKFKGDIDINCIVNENGAYPLEATPRFGSPAIYLHSEIQTSPWGEFLKAIADGKQYKVEWKKGLGMVLVLAVPPFPYAYKIEGNSPKGVDIYFNTSITKEDFKHIYFEGVAVKNLEDKKQYYISDHQGYVLYITSIADNIDRNREQISDIVKKIYIPKVLYRNDIGIDFKNNTQARLKELGYI